MRFATAALLALTTAAPSMAVTPPPPTPPPPVTTVQTEPSPRLSCDQGCLSAVEAVTYASYLGEKAGVAAVFEMSVVEVGQQGRTFYLNSEADYRDRNCLTVAITPAAMTALVGSTDLDTVRKRLRKHRVIVGGIARQVRIDFTNDGKPSGKYYYQVHVRVGDPRQVRLVT